MGNCALLYVCRHYSKFPGPLMKYLYRIKVSFRIISDGINNKCNSTLKNLPYPTEYNDISTHSYVITSSLVTFFRDGIASPSQFLQRNETLLKNVYFLYNTRSMSRHIQKISDNVFAKHTMHCTCSLQNCTYKKQQSLN